ncbi:unnamed protein product [Musa textilis]
MAIVPCRGTYVPQLGVQPQATLRNASPGSRPCCITKLVLMPQISTSTSKYLASSHASFLGPVSSSALFYNGPHLNTRRNWGARFIVRADLDYYSVLGVSRNASKSEIKSGKYTLQDLAFLFYLGLLYFLSCCFCIYRHMMQVVFSLL